MTWGCPVNSESQSPIEPSVEPKAVAKASGQASAEPLTERIRRIQEGLLNGLVERETPMRLALLAAIAGEHTLLLGPPGTAKSELARRLRTAFVDSTYFERLLTRFSVPEELFGPLSIRGLDDDRYERLTEGYLPTASIAFLDEIFKANSAILNALLTLLNEREFDNGTQRLKTPLVSVIGASNELPQVDELGALYDRFLVRVHCGPVTSDGFAELIELCGESQSDVESKDQFTAEELEKLRSCIEGVTLSDEICELLVGMREYFAEQQIQVSDRRWRKIIKLLKASALTCGRPSVSIWDCWLIQHCAWHQPEQRESIASWYESRVGEGTLQDPGQLTRLVGAWEERLERDRKSGPQKRNSRDDLLYYDEEGNETTDEYENSYNPKNPRKPVIETRRYSEGHIRERTTEGASIIATEIIRVRERVTKLQASVRDDIRSHLWIDAKFAEPACSRLQERDREYGGLQSRIDAVIAGFKGLPREESTESPADFQVVPRKIRDDCRAIGQWLLDKQRTSGDTPQSFLDVYADMDNWQHKYSQFSLRDGVDAPWHVVDAVERIADLESVTKHKVAAGFWAWLASGCLTEDAVEE